jgi:hypothetical protein
MGITMKEWIPLSFLKRQSKHALRQILLDDHLKENTSGNVMKSGWEK